MCDKPWCTCEDVAFHEEELTRLRASLAAAEDKNATLMRDLELACRDLAAVKESRSAAEAKLADEVRHADELADHMQSLADSGYEFNHPRNTALVDNLLAAHAARRAHDAKCESEFDSQVHAHTPCGCAARRAGNAVKREEGKR